MSVREGLLALLDREPRTGRQLTAAFEAATDGAWELDSGQVFTALDQLARDGRVAPGPGGDAGRRYYAITELGREELAHWLGSGLADARPPCDDLLLKILICIGTPEIDARDVIRVQRTAIVETLQADRRRLRAGAVGGAGLASRLVSDAQIVRPEADLRWLDLCEQRIAQAAYEPTRRTPA